MLVAEKVLLLLVISLTDDQKNEILLKYARKINQIPPTNVCVILCIYFLMVPCVFSGNVISLTKHHRLTSSGRFF